MNAGVTGAERDAILSEFDTRVSDLDIYYDHIDFGDHAFLPQPVHLIQVMIDDLCRSQCLDNPNVPFYVYPVDDNGLALTQSYREALEMSLGCPFYIVMFDSVFTSITFRICI